MGGNRTDHWDSVYRTKKATDVSWFQTDPQVSMRLIAEAAPPPRSVLDVGAGASLLVDSLLAAGLEDVTVLDVSETALAAVRHRLGLRASAVSFVVADVTSWTPERRWGVWHDRAVFHFLTNADDRAAYVAAAGEAVGPGGIVVLGTFALDGPEQCSGLATVRYDAEGLAGVFAGRFRLERSEREVHPTPSGGEQAFTWVVLRRTSD